MLINNSVNYESTLLSADSAGTSISDDLKAVYILEDTTWNCSQTA